MDRKSQELKPITGNLANIPRSEKRADCERCGKRARFKDRKWCKVCIARWEIEQQGKLYKLIDDTIPKLYRDARMQDLSKELQQEYLTLPDWQGLYLWGQEGRGKTYASAAFAIAYLNDGFSVIYTNYDLLCSWIRSTYQPKAKETEFEIINQLAKPDKLFVDDVGVTVTNQESDFSLRIFYSIIDKRISSMKPTFVTSNKNIEGIGKSFDMRISSRLKRACKVIQASGEDRRLAI